MANIKTFDLNLLKVLDALLRTGSTIRAADRVGLSQPAVSAALSRLRHALGDPLFVREGIGLRPTDYALALAEPVQRILDSTEQVLTGPESFDPARLSRRFAIAGGCR